MSPIGMLTLFLQEENRANTDTSDAIAAKGSTFISIILAILLVQSMAGKLACFSNLSTDRAAL
jgi:hypothetical protein